MADVKSIGLIETKSFVAAVAAADAIKKSTNVALTAHKQPDDRTIAIEITGDVGAINAAIEVGSQAADSKGGVVSVHVFPRLDPDVLKMFGLGQPPKN